MSTTGTTQKRTRKAGKTLLLRSRNNSSVDETFFTEENLNGFDTFTKVSNDIGDTYYLVFKTIPSAIKGLRTLRNVEDKDYFVIYVDYQVFFSCRKLEGISCDEKLEHGELKEGLRQLFKDNINTHLLYPPRLYRKDGKYTGVGVITVDTREGLLFLLSNEHRVSKIGEYELNFYRFKRMNKEEET